MELTFVDLGMIPLCQTYISRDHLEESEVFYPLRAGVCTSCWYVGLPEYVSAQDIFTEYAYFSSYSTSWVAYIERSVAEMVTTYSLDQHSQVIEMASNDGYLLQFFVQRGIPALGIEPAANVAAVANERGIRTLPRFFNTQTSRDLLADGIQADLLLAYNCLDHVPDPNDIVDAMRMLLKPSGVIHVELPYLRSLVEENEFDTIYHDHFSYLSLTSIDELFRRRGLRVFDAERIPTHGGSLRFRACHEGDEAHPIGGSVATLLSEEEAIGMRTPEFYSSFMRQVARTKHQLLECLIDLKREAHSIIGYGVPAKGNVLLNYCGIRSDFLDYLVDLNPFKFGKFSPGTRIEIRPVDEIKATRPSHILILPWNIKDEIMTQLAFARDWGARFLVAVPRVEMF
jgi:SAM-dependent methyltransferase